MRFIQRRLTPRVLHFSALVMIMNSSPLTYSWNVSDFDFPSSVIEAGEPRVHLPYLSLFSFDKLMNYLHYLECTVAYT